MTDASENVKQLADHLGAQLHCEEENGRIIYKYKINDGMWSPPLFEAEAIESLRSMVPAARVIPHSRGPWTYQVDEYEANVGRLLRIEERSVRWIARIQHNGRDMPARQLADGHLWAAAPELLAVVRKLLEWQDEAKLPVPRVYLEQARAAVAKAEGRT